MKNGIYQEAADLYAIFRNGEKIEAHSSLVVAQFRAAMNNLPMELQESKQDETNPR